MYGQKASYGGDLAARAIQPHAAVAGIDFPPDRSGGGVDLRRWRLSPRNPRLSCATVGRAGIPADPQRTLPLPLNEARNSRVGSRADSSATSRSSITTPWFRLLGCRRWWTAPRRPALGLSARCIASGNQLPRGFTWREARRDSRSTMAAASSTNRIFSMARRCRRSGPAARARAGLSPSSVGLRALVRMVAVRAARPARRAAAERRRAYRPLLAGPSRRGRCLLGAKLGRDVSSSSAVRGDRPALLSFALEPGLERSLDRAISRQMGSRGRRSGFDFARQVARQSSPLDPGAVPQSSAVIWARAGAVRRESPDGAARISRQSLPLSAGPFRDAFHRSGRRILTGNCLKFSTLG